MLEFWGLESKLRIMNTRHRPAQALYLYRDPIYSIVYGILGSHKNYLG